MVSKVKCMPAILNLICLFNFSNWRLICYCKLNHWMQISFAVHSWITFILFIESGSLNCSFLLFVCWSFPATGNIICTSNCCSLSHTEWSNCKLSHFTATVFLFDSSVGRISACLFTSLTAFSTWPQLELNTANESWTFLSRSVLENELVRFFLSFYKALPAIWRRDLRHVLKLVFRFSLLPFFFKIPDIKLRTYWSTSTS